MGSSNKKIFTDSIVYMVGMGLSRGFILLTIPVFTRYLSKDQYATYNLVYSFAIVFLGLVNFGQDSAIARFFYDVPTADNRRKTASTGLLIQFLILLLFFLLILFFGQNIGSFLLGRKGEIIGHWYLALGILPFLMLSYFSLNIFKWLKRPWLYAIFSVAESAIVFCISLIFIVFLGSGINAIIWAYIVAGAICGFLGLMVNRNLLSFKSIDFKSGMFRKLMLFGLPIAGSCLLSAFIPIIDRFFLSRWTTFDVLAEYTLSAQLASAVFLVVSAFNNVTGPVLYESWDLLDFTSIFKRLLRYYVLTSLAMNMLIVVFLILTIHWIAPGYEKVLYILPVLLLSNLAEGMINFTTLGIVYSNKTKFFLGFYVLQFSSTVFFNIVFIHFFGFIGAAYAILLSKCIVVVLSYLISKRFLKIDFDAKRTLALFAIYLLAQISVVHFFSKASLLNTLLLLIVSLVFSLAYYFIGLTRDERTKINTRIASVIHHKS